MLQLCCKVHQCLLKIRNFEDLEHIWGFVDLLHQPCKVGVNAFELVVFVAQHRLDVCASEKDPFKVNIPSLNVNPVVEDHSNLLKSLGPGLNIFFKNLVVGGHLHAVDVVHVVIYESEQVVPPFDQLALRLVLHKFNFAGCPDFLDVINEVF